MGQPVLQIIIGSTRPGRVGPAVADWITDMLDELVRYAEALRPLRSS